jgi:hypothetical protein
MPVPKTKTTALAKRPTSAVSLHPDSAKIISAQHDLKESIIPLKQYESILKFALTGGKTAGWGLVGGSAALIVGIVLHSLALGPIALVGLMAGMGLYSTRIFRDVPETDAMVELHAYLRDLKLYWVQGFITEEEYVKAKEKALKSKRIL